MRKLLSFLLILVGILAVLPACGVGTPETAETLSPASEPIAWEGTYQNNEGMVIISEQKQDSFAFQINVAMNNSTGSLEAVAAIEGETARYEEEGFTLYFQLENQKLHVWQEGTNPYAGTNVAFSGYFMAE